MNYGLNDEPDLKQGNASMNEKFQVLLIETIEILRTQYPHNVQVEFIHALRNGLADSRAEEIERMQNNLAELESEHKRLKELIILAQKGNSELRG